jgi:predicted nucleic acid-binding Zn ribbon protein
MDAVGGRSGRHREENRDGRGEMPMPIGDALDRVLRSLRAPTARTVKTVFSEWPSVAGAQLAAHAQPVALRDGELVVEVDDPTWASQLRWLEPELRSRLESLPGGPRVERIRFRLRASRIDDDAPRKRRAGRRDETH